MKLKKLVNKLGTNINARITILDVFYDYLGGVEKLKKEEFYQENKNRKVKYMDILNEGKLPELVIVLKDK